MAQLNQEHGYKVRPYCREASDDRYDRVSDIFRYPEEEYYSRYERSEENPSDINLDDKAFAPMSMDYNR